MEDWIKPPWSPLEKGFHSRPSPPTTLTSRKLSQCSWSLYHHHRCSRRHGLTSPKCTDLPGESVSPPQNHTCFQTGEISALFTYYTATGPEWTAARAGTHKECHHSNCTTSHKREIEFSWRKTNSTLTDSKVPGTHQSRFRGSIKWWLIYSLPRI